MRVNSADVIDMRGRSASALARPRAIDLFAGIGGIRHGFDAVGYQTVFTSEWNKYAVQTYEANFGGSSEVVGDITEVDPSDIPDHDVLLAGFPCQPFSLAGVSKKNALGRPHGFADETQGTLFFEIVKILDEKRPAAFLLENVKNLKSHDRGRTFDVIQRTLTDELGYEFHARVLNGKAFTPQSRERILMIGFRDDSGFDWNELSLPAQGPALREILHSSDGTEPYLPWDGDRFFDHSETRVQPKYTLTDKLWAYLQGYAAKHRAAGNGFGFGLVGPEDVSRTLSARYYKDGSEILVRQGRRWNPRRLTPRECARLMGFPDTFRIPVSDTQAYKQFGNSVVVPLMEAVAGLMFPHVGLALESGPAIDRIAVG